MKTLKMSVAAAALMLAATGFSPAFAQMSGESPNPSESVGDSTRTEELTRAHVKMEMMQEENSELKRIVATLLAENERLKASTKN